MTDFESLRDTSWVGEPPAVEVVSGRAAALVWRRRLRTSAAGLAAVALVGTGAVALGQGGDSDRLVPARVPAGLGCPATFTGPSSTAPDAATRLFPAEVDAFLVCTYDDVVPGQTGGAVAQLRLSRPVAVADVDLVKQAFDTRSTQAVERPVPQLLCLSAHQHRVLVLGAGAGEVLATAEVRDPCSAFLSNGTLTTAPPDATLSALLGITTELGLDGRSSTYQVAGTLDGPDGKPTTGTVTITPASPSGRDDSAALTTETDDAGRFVFYVPSGSYEVVGSSIDGIGCASGPVVVRPNTNTLVPVGCLDVRTGPSPPASAPSVAPPACPTIYTGARSAAPDARERLFPADTTTFAVCVYEGSGSTRIEGIALERRRPVAASDAAAVAGAFADLRDDGTQRDCAPPVGARVLITGAGPGSTTTVALLSECGGLLTNGALTAPPTPPLRRLLGLQLDARDDLLVERAEQAAARADGPVTRVEAVRSTRAAVAALLPASANDLRPVYVVQVQGGPFTCHRCPVPAVLPVIPAPRTSVVTLIIDVDSLSGYTASSSPQPPDLTALGEVTVLRG